jgi:hypothetical protein
VNSACAGRPVPVVAAAHASPPFLPEPVWRATGPGSRRVRPDSRRAPSLPPERGRRRPAANARASFASPRPARSQQVAARGLGRVGPTAGRVGADPHSIARTAAPRAPQSGFRTPLLSRRTRGLGPGKRLSGRRNRRSGLRIPIAGHRGSGREVFCPVRAVPSLRAGQKAPSRQGETPRGRSHVPRLREPELLDRGRAIARKARSLETTRPGASCARRIIRRSAVSRSRARSWTSLPESFRPAIGVRSPARNTFRLARRAGSLAVGVRVLCARLEKRQSQGLEPCAQDQQLRAWSFSPCGRGPEPRAQGSRLRSALQGAARGPATMRPEPGTTCVTDRRPPDSPRARGLSRLTAFQRPPTLVPHRAGLSAG